MNCFVLIQNAASAREAEEARAAAESVTDRGIDKEEAAKEAAAAAMAAAAAASAGVVVSTSDDDASKENERAAAAAAAEIAALESLVAADAAVEEQLAAAMAAAAAGSIAPFEKWMKPGITYEYLVELGLLHADAAALMPLVEADIKAVCIVNGGELSAEAVNAYQSVRDMCRDHSIPCIVLTPSG